MLSETTLSRKNLNETELRMVAEVAIEMARAVGRLSNVHEGAMTLARAALKDAEFKADLQALHRSIMTRQAKDPRRMLAPLAPLLSKLERDAEKVLGAAAS
jgi:hypothetical protein